MSGDNGSDPLRNGFIRDLTEGQGKVLQTLGRLEEKIEALREDNTERKNEQEKFQRKVSTEFKSIRKWMTDHEKLHAEETGKKSTFDKRLVLVALSLAIGLLQGIDPSILKGLIAAILGG